MRGSGEGASERGGESVGEMGRAFLEGKGPQRQDGKDTESLEPPVCVPEAFRTVCCPQKSWTDC